MVSFIYLTGAVLALCTSATAAPLQPWKAHLGVSSFFHGPHFNGTTLNNTAPIIILQSRSPDGSATSPSMSDPSSANTTHKFYLNYASTLRASEKQFGRDMKKCGKRKDCYAQACTDLLTYIDDEVSSNMVEDLDLSTSHDKEAIENFKKEHEADISNIHDMFVKLSETCKRRGYKTVTCINGLPELLATQIENQEIHKPGFEDSVDRLDELGF
ncbi:uncharacterized protein LY89DRAFT_738809 [Mollisia scopiformis]|uniref:Uncharacterized protein n=1 Tax=Mollisia scopiformis TaxID=149040 RepID=A0A194WX77_MOLSC|nr:uncharacterized protein LY89DRAFT_738809 [Mollisia scopiformis]KUJ12192.1 hypothetical protein LY89DRAFT_738809 [Mollisia scopiformis]